MAFKLPIRRYAAKAAKDLDASGKPEATQEDEATQSWKKVGSGRFNCASSRRWIPGALPRERVIQPLWLCSLSSADNTRRDFQCRLASRPRLNSVYPEGSVRPQTASACPMGGQRRLTHAWFHSRGPAHSCVTCSRKRKVTHVKNVRKVLILK